MKILGISCFYHDSAACLLEDGRVVAMAQEERFSRRKHDPDFPRRAIDYCLREGHVSAPELDAVGFYDKPFVKFERILQTTIAAWPKGLFSFLRAMPVWIKEKIWMSHLIRKELGFAGALYYGEHHLSHAASAFYASGFEDAAVLTADGVGEWATTSLAQGTGKGLRILAEIHFPHSLGLFYSAFTYFLGFKVNSGEYKVMGLAPYGEPRFKDLILRELIDLREDGSFKLNLSYFPFTYGGVMTGRKFEKLFGLPRRRPESELGQIHFDLAASVQAVIEQAMLGLARRAFDVTRSDRLCLAGGVALNCVANGKILREGPFRDVFIQPAAGDAGGAYGVAAFIAHALFGKARTGRWDHAFYGPSHEREDIRRVLEVSDAVYDEYNDERLVDETARRLADGKVVGWMRGRMEVGPRALGHRSILADPRDAGMKDRVNMKIKFRESFRPFAPVTVRERCGEFFDLDRESPFMMLVASVRGAEPIIPSVTHVDGTARVQTVAKEIDPVYHRLVERFGRLSGVPVLINTSFNVRGEPMVCTPEDAWRCFMRTRMDSLVIGNFLLDKDKQNRKEETPEAWLSRVPAD
ncbi:MAG: carbamoyltransferase [Candidatus Omnitrophica bacterium]|nr:carbamoyltransferase [Candidatus Omnitrophota bacterium]